MSEQNKSGGGNRSGGNKPSGPGNRSNNRNRNNKKRYNKNRNNKNSKAKGTQSSEGQGNKKPQGKGPKSKSNFKKRNNNRRPKSLTPARVAQKYDNLLEQHVVARRKLYEMSGRADKKMMEKLDRNFMKTLQELRDFEANLKEDWQKEVIAKKVDGLPKDTLISETHNEETIQVEFEGDFEDQHLLPTQKASNWAEDTEESSGTMEDYEKYKASVQ